MGDGSIIALMSVVVRDRRTKGGLCCGGHESTRPVAVCGGAGGSEGEGEEADEAALNDLGRDVDSKYQQTLLSRFITNSSLYVSTATTNVNDRHTLEMRVFTLSSLTTPPRVVLCEGSRVHQFTDVQGFRTNAFVIVTSDTIGYKRG